MQLRFKQKREQFRNWWYGEPKVFEDENFVHFYVERPPFAVKADALLAFCKRNGWQIVSTAIAIIGLWLAYLAVK